MKADLRGAGGFFGNRKFPIGSLETSVAPLAYFNLIIRRGSKNEDAFCVAIANSDPPTPIKRNVRVF